MGGRRRARRPPPIRPRSRRRGPRSSSIARLDEPAARAWLDGADGEAEAASAIARAQPRPAPAARRGRRSRDARGHPRPGAGGAHRLRRGRAGGRRALGRRRASCPSPAPATRRDAALRPQERLSALLGTRDAALACEELTLRARADVDAGRRREAALQLRVALQAAVAELPPWSERGDLVARIAELEELRARRRRGRRRGAARRASTTRSSPAPSTSSVAWRRRCARGRPPGSTERAETISTIWPSATGVRCAHVDTPTPADVEETTDCSRWPRRPSSSSRCGAST